MKCPRIWNLLYYILDQLLRTNIFESESDIVDRLANSMKSAVTERSDEHLKTQHYPKNMSKLFARPGSKDWKGVKIRSQLSSYCQISQSSSSSLQQPAVSSALLRLALFLINPATHPPVKVKFWSEISEFEHNSVQSDVIVITS